MKMSCKKHADSPIVKVCVSCNDQLVSAECAVDHNFHIFRDIEEIGKERQKTLLQNLKETEAVILSIKHDLQDLERLREENKITSQDVMDKIQRRGQDLKDAVEQYTRQLVVICERQQKDFDCDIDETKVRLDSELANVSLTHGKLQEALESGSFPVIIEMEKYHRNNHVRRQVEPVQPLRKVSFVPGTGTVGHLRQIFGDVDIQDNKSYENVDYTKEEEIQAAKRRKRDSNYSVCETTVTTAFEQTTSSFGICFLCPSPTSVDDCWMRLERMKEIKLVSRTGTLKETVYFDTTVACISGTADNRIVVTCPDDHTIKEVLPNGTPKTLFHLDRLSPRALCKTPEGNLLVTLVEKWSYALSASSTRKLAKYTVKGYKMAEAEYDGYRKRLFLKPSRVAASPVSGDIAVINRTEYEISHLVLLDKHLRLKFRYFGDGNIIPSHKRYYGKESVQFCPQDVNYDSGNNILIAELYSRSIQMIDCDGHLLKILNTDPDIPWSITVQVDHQVWAGYDSGKVKVLSYLL